MREKKGNPVVGIRVFMATFPDDPNGLPHHIVLENVNEERMTVSSFPSEEEAKEEFDEWCKFLLR